MHVIETRCEGVDWIKVALKGSKSGFFYKQRYTDFGIREKKRIIS